MPTINLSKDELLALQKLLQFKSKGKLRDVEKKVNEAVKAVERLEQIRTNYLF